VSTFFQHWLRGHLDRNTGFDDVLKEVITAGGSTFSNPAANYYRVARDPQQLAARRPPSLFFRHPPAISKCQQPSLRTMDAG